jgi:hypothetical protein
MQLMSIKTDTRTVNNAYRKIYQKRGNTQICGFNPFTPYRRYEYSMRQLRRRLGSINAHWNVFLHLTYSDKYVDSACMDHPRKLMNVIKQFYRNRVRMYENGGRRKGKDGKYIRDLDGNIKIYPKRPKMAQKYREKNEMFKFFVKTEFDSSGKRTYHPHFHILIESPSFLSIKFVRRHWKYGRIVKLNRIKNREKAKTYIRKYMSKSSIHELWQGRIWSHSRNLPAKKNSDWEYIGVLPFEKYYLLKVLNEQPIKNAYLILILKKEARRIGRYFLNYG